MQITGLLVLSPSGPAGAACEAASRILYKMLGFPQCLVAEDRACSIFRPALPPTRRSLSGNETHVRLAL